MRYNDDILPIYDSNMITPQIIKNFNKQHSIGMYYDKRKQYPISLPGLKYNKRTWKQKNLKISKTNNYWHYNK
jgi:hypothetical protein